MLETLAAPLVSPVSLATAKGWLRETTNTWDATITAIVKAAVSRAERVSKNAIIYRPVRERFDFFLPYFELVGYPCLGVKSITYLDSSGATQTLAPASYIVDATKPRPRITPAYAQYFPPTRVIMNSVTVNYDIGLAVPITSVDTAADTVTAPGANKAAGDIVQLWTDGGTVPSGLTASPTSYYVVNPVAPVNGLSDTFQLAATAGGAAIDITAAQALVAPVFIGLIPDEMLLAIQLMCGTWNENREGVSPAQLFEMPSHGAPDALLTPFMPRGW